MEFASTRLVGVQLGLGATGRSQLSRVQVVPHLLSPVWHSPALYGRLLYTRFISSCMAATDEFADTSFFVGVIVAVCLFKCIVRTEILCLFPDVYPGPSPQKNQIHPYGGSAGSLAE